MTYRILTASYTDKITTLVFEPSSFSLKVASSVPVGQRPSWIISYPGDSTVVFACLEQQRGEIVAVKYDKDGVGKVVGTADSGGAHPCSLIATEHEIFVANYASGNIAVLPLSHSPPYLSSLNQSAVQLHGSGPNEDRQLSSHPHQVSFLPNRHELLVPDLGSDKTWRIVQDKDGKWTAAEYVIYDAGCGPRHAAVHDNYLYTVLELTSSVAVHRLLPFSDGSGATHSVTLPTMTNPPSIPNDMAAAEILIPPPNTSFPTPYAYISNRNDPSPNGDTIAIFSIGNPENVRLVAEVRTGLKHVRSLALGGDNDRWLMAGGVRGGGVKVFERVDGGKGLKEVAVNDDIQAPSGFLWM